MSVNNNINTKFETKIISDKILKLEPKQRYSFLKAICNRVYPGSKLILPNGKRINAQEDFARKDGIPDPSI